MIELSFLDQKIYFSRGAMTGRVKLNIKIWASCFNSLKLTTQH